MCTDEPYEIWICACCIKEPFLRDRIENEGLWNICTYCGDQNPCFTLDKVSDATETAIAQHFVRTPTEPSAMEYAMIKHGALDWYRDGDEIESVIENLLLTSPGVASAVQQCLEGRYEDHFSEDETEFASGSHYEESRVDTDNLDGMWAKFVSSLRTESRFINHSVKVTLDGIFSGVDSMQAGRKQAVIMKAGPGTTIPVLYRARWSRNTEELKRMLVLPDRELGPPPHQFSGANRMSARGISVFYGSSTVQAAIPEIRPPVGCNVASAGFRLIRPLRLLNLPALKSVWESGSMFDPDYTNKLAQVAFLRTLSSLMTDPVLPGEEEFHYIPTQVIAEYLADAKELSLDGILYSSVQNPALPASEHYNVVLFHKASRVRNQPLPSQSNCMLSFGHQTDEHEWEMDIRVTQIAEDEVPANETTWYEETPHESDTREPALEVDLATVSFHRINGVHFDFSSEPVSRNKHIMDKRARRPDMPVPPLPGNEDLPDDVPF